MKRVPVCFGDYRQRDRMCNGSKSSDPCLMRDRCSAFKGMVEDGGEKRETFLRLNRNWAYLTPELVSSLDVRIARLGIQDGLPRLAGGKRRLPMLEPKSSAKDLVDWFIQQLSTESRRTVAPRKGQAEIGQLFWEYRKSGDFDVRCRATDFECPILVSLRPKTRSGEIDASIPIPGFQETLNKRERLAIQAEAEEASTLFKGLNRYRVSVVAMRLARAINGGRMSMPYEMSA